MELALAMSSHFNSPVGYWLEGMTIIRLEEFSRIAYRMVKSQKQATQEVGPGL
jgi:hypothetical protein